MSQAPYILNIESTTETCSVSIGAGAETAALQEAEKPNDHSKVMTLLVERCCQEAGIGLKDLQAVALSSGPGSYTSLRIGASVSKGLCYALDVPLIAVPTLDALARAAYHQVQDDEALYCPMMDARRMEVYCALYDSKGRRVSPASPKIIDRHSFYEYLSNNKKMIFFGPGSGKTRCLLDSPQAFFSEIRCSAVHLQAISAELFLEKRFENAAFFRPEYLKPPNITVPKHSKKEEG